MTNIYNSDNIYTKKSPVNGMGVFARRELRKGDVILVDPVLVLSANDVRLATPTAVSSYWYEWGTRTCAICLGAGSLFNHSYKPNAIYESNIQGKKMVFTALRNIPIGKEIFINYNGEPTSKARLWFHIAT